MSDDARALKGRRVLYIANPGSDSEGTDDDLSLPRPKYIQQQPAPLTTNVSHHSSSHPSLSSPSSTSSPAADESTPPPSTPGLSIPPVDLSTDPTIQEPVIASHTNDRNLSDGPQITITSRKGKFLQTLKSPFQSHSRHQRPTIDTPPKRPRTSPTVSIPDSSNATSAVSDKVLIVVTTDSDWYVTVDISSAKSAAVIRECIFNKLNILDEDQFHFSIYQTEMGAFAIGDALTDEKLFSLCHQQGDTKGSLKFFVSHSSAAVHEQPLRPRSPTAVTIPPPVLPYNNNHLPLQLKRRSKQESVSSTSEQHPLETAAGYEADLDNPDRDSHRTAVHPSPPVTTPLGSGNSSTSPNNARRPNVLTQPSITPLPRPLHSNTPPLLDGINGTGNDSNSVEKPSQFVSPPPLSPNRPNFLQDEDSLGPPVNKGVHGRSGSDAGAEREQALKATEQQLETVSKQWRIRQPQASGGRLKTEPSREVLLSKDSRRKLLPNDLNDPWVVVPSSSPRTNEKDVSPPAQDLSRATAHSSSRQQVSPARYKSGYSTRVLAMPANPRQTPPAVPAASSDTRTPSRPAGVPLPPGSVVAWRGEERGEPKAAPPSPQLRRLNKVAKSMDNLRASAFGHLSALQPGGARRQPPQLPMTRPTANMREQIAFSSGGSSSGLPKSYEAPRQLRPLPVQGSSHSGTPDSGQNPYSVRGGTFMSSREPYPRPQSALGDSLASPTHQYPRQLQSPTYGNISDAGEPIRSPRAISPSRAYHIRSKPDAVYGNRADPFFDTASAVETSNTTPPRTPVSPRSPHRPASEKRGDTESPLFCAADSTNNSNRSSESTLRQQDQILFSNIFAQNSEATLVPPVMYAAEKRPRSPPPTSSVGEMIQSNLSSQYDDESDSGGDDCGTSMWKKPPMVDPKRPKSILRPPLKVQIASSSATQQQGKTLHSDIQHATFAPPPIPPIPPSHLANTPPLLPRGRVNARGGKGGRGSTFTEMQDSTWAPRPPPEDVYERLEEFFPEHDLDKPLIEASSGGTSPTAADTSPVLAPPVPVPSDKTTRIKGKKSIRLVAQEHKKLIDRTSRGDSSSYSNVLRKRSTKLWGSKVEEVTTAQAKVYGSSTLPESSPGGSSTFKWVRGELIGRGTYGRVYLALNATTGEMIAVKQVEAPQTASDKNDSRQVTVVQALKLESETLKDLDHPNIVQYLGFEETPSNLSIFLEYVPGGSIGSCLLKHGKFGEDVTKSFTAQILSGLEYLHSKGILHRDLKADNILVEMSGTCKISDFGISKRTDDGSGGAFTAMKGTVFWMAPEVINTKKKGYNFKVDIWSVGCVVLEMWAGSRPWMGDEVVAVMFKLYQSKHPPPIPEDVVLSELADDFRRKCFAINPEERPAAAELRKHKYLELPPDWVFTGF